VTHASPSMIRKRTKQMAAFLVVYDPSTGNERKMIEALHRWSATRIFRGAWVIEFDSTADLARRALIAVGGAITCAIVEIKPNGDHAEIETEPAARDALRRFGAPASAP
jgi:hypothetical protein